MSEINHQALREAAENATCGEWSLEYGEGRFDGDDALIHREAAGYIPICRIEGAHPESGFDEDFQMEQQANAEFIAAANPATVLTLLNELETAKKRIAELGSEPVSQTYKLNELAGNSPVIPGEVLSAILKVARVRADFDDFDGDRRGIGDCLDEAEQELIVTINKYASQLAAGPIAPNDVREQTAVPPVPVIQADVAQAIEKLKRKLVECNRYNYCADAVKGVEYACHAAMLQGSQPVSQTYNLPELIEGMEVSIDVSTCDADLGNRYFGTVTEALELDTAKNGYILLVQDAEPNFDVNGNSPVTPDSWISCSDRMPEKNQNVLISVNFDSSLVEPLICSARYTGSTFRRGDATIKPGNGIEQATHWMPLPEPPQEMK